MERDEGRPVDISSHPRHGVKLHLPQRTHIQTLESSPFTRQSRSPFSLSSRTSVPIMPEQPPALRERFELPPLTPSIRNRPQVQPYNRSSFDFRRPVSTMNNQTSNVIDLTEDDTPPRPQTTHLPNAAGPSSTAQRLPRFPRDIIDLSEDTTVQHADHSREGRIRAERRHVAAGRGEEAGRQQYFRRETSSEIQFMGQRPRSRGAQEDDTQVQADLPPLIGINDDDDDDDVVHVRTVTNEPTGVNNPGPLGRVIGVANTIGVAEYLNQQRARNVIARERSFGGIANRISQRLFGVQALRQFQDDETFELLDEDGPPARRLHRAFAPPNLDYTNVQFALFPGEPVRRRPATPPYEAPPPLAEGFTGSPTEDQVVVCPSCGDELATGRTDEKKQVWVVKACGHVYCGGCMLNRKQGRAASSKGKGRADQTQLRGTCVVPGCSTKITPKAAIQVFL